MSVGLHVIISLLPSTCFPCNWCNAHYELKEEEEEEDEEEKEEENNKYKPSFYLLKDPESGIISSVQNCLSLFSCCCIKCRFFSPPQTLLPPPPPFSNIWFLSVFIFLVKVKLSQDFLSYQNSCKPFDSTCPISNPEPPFCPWEGCPGSCSSPEPSPSEVTVLI